MTTVLITGANGFIGSTIVEKALSLGWNVTAAIRKGSDLSHLKTFSISYLEVNYSNKIELTKILTESPTFDYIIHNAGTTKASTKEAYLEVNLGYTQTLVESLIESNRVPRKFLFVSSLAAIGPVKYGKTIDAHTIPTPVTWYGQSKLAAERYLETLLNFPWLVIQPTGVFGPKDKDIFIFIKMINKGLELYIGNKEQNLSFIFSEDLADLMLTILQKGTIHQKYIGSDFKNYVSSDLGNAVKSASLVKTIKLKIPASVINLVAILSEKIGKIQGKTPPLNLDKMNELTAESWWCNPDNLPQKVFWQPKFDLFTGMQKTIKWYKDNKWL